MTNFGSNVLPKRFGAGAPKARPLRAALLPTPGDPWLVDYWLRNFPVWADEVDELHVHINGQTDPEVLAHIEVAFAKAKPGAVSIIEDTSRVDHGVALGQLLEKTEAELVMLAEDDCYVRRSGAIDAMFKLLEADECDVVGSPRGSASMELHAAAWERWPDSAGTASLDEGHGLWPAFLFTRKETLLATDRHFGARIWQPGDHVDGLDYDVPDPGIVMSADTFGSCAWQLRGADLRIRHEAQYRIADEGFMAGWLEHDPPWFHIGSLSSGYGMAFAGGENQARIDLTIDGTDHIEWARRLYWWEKFAETAYMDDLREQRTQYAAAVQGMIAAIDARSLVDRWSAAFRPWVNWDDGT